MKLFALILFLFCSCEALKVAKNASNQAITELVNLFYVRDGQNFDVIQYESTSRCFDDVIAGFVSMPYNLIKIKNSQLWHHKLNQSALILVESLESAKNFIAKVDLNNDTPKKLRFLLYIRDKNGSQIFDAIDKNLPYYYDVGNFTQLSFFLIETTEILQLRTIEWYTEDVCGRFQVPVINEFSKTTKKWRKELEIHEKFRNFHNCMISVFVDPIFEGKYDEHYKKVMGFVPDLAHAVAQVGNFLPRLQLPRSKQQPDGIVVYQNAYLGAMTTRLMTTLPVHVTSAFQNAKMYLVLSPPQKYSNWEKVLLPFDETTWMLILITFGTALSLTFIANNLPRKLHDKLFGFGVQVRAYNILGTFFGIGQLNLPLEIYARIILISFVFFCLVIRTAYQGNLFQCLLDVYLNSKFNFQAFSLK